MEKLQTGKKQTKTKQNGDNYICIYTETDKDTDINTDADIE